MEAIPTKLTPKLIIEMDKIVKEWWFANRSELIREAVRELVKKSRIERLEVAVKEDIQFGLYEEEWKLYLMQIILFIWLKLVVWVLLNILMKLILLMKLLNRQDIKKRYSS